MLKTACLFTGENYNLLSADTPSSRKKVVAMSIAILIPTLIWLFNGFILSFQVLKASLGWSLLVGVLCGSIVFFIEKLVVMANGNRWLTFFRICIGLFIALLGSITIDEVVFKDDIDISVYSIKEKAINNAKIKEENYFALLNHIPELDNEIRVAQIKYDKASESAVEEADGSQGTGHQGIGRVAKFKDQKAKERKQDLNNLFAKKQNLNIIKDSLVNNTGIKEMTEFHENALLTRIKGLFELVFKDKYMLWVYILFTLLLFFFEFLVVILKVTWKKTNYERKLEMIEEIGIKRMEFLQRKDSPLADPGNYLYEFQQARNVMKRSHSLYN